MPHSGNHSLCLCKANQLDFQNIQALLRREDQNETT